VDTEQLNELLYQSLETERGGVKVYESAVECAQNEELRKEWTKYLEETQTHERIMLRVLEVFGLDPDLETPGRAIIRMKAGTLVKSMQDARSAAPRAAQLVAAECVVEAESKDHMNWELMGEAAKKLSGDQKKVLTEAFEEVGEQENEHLYHTMGWARELWLDALGLPAVLPPPEEERHTKTAIGAERAKQDREQML
jgi:rubrerythrin